MYSRICICVDLCRFFFSAWMCLFIYEWISVLWISLCVFLCGCVCVYLRRYVYFCVNNRVCGFLCVCVPAFSSGYASLYT